MIIVHCVSNITPLYSFLPFSVYFTFVVFSFFTFYFFTV